MEIVFMTNRKDSGFEFFHPACDPFLRLSKKSKGVASAVFVNLEEAARRSVNASHTIERIEIEIVQLDCNNEAFFYPDCQHI
jgi:hypothetical protein